MSDAVESGPRYDVIVEWMEKAEKNCKNTGRREAAMLWHDARLFLQNEHKQLSAAQKEIEELKRQIAEGDAKIDALMLEYCPDEMTQEQKDNYAKNQRQYI